jgi:hypothetical protein
MPSAFDCAHAAFKLAGAIGVVADYRAVPIAALSAKNQEA